MAVLELDRVSKRIGKKQILNEVSFSAVSGEICGIVGKNGAGKSMLLRIAAGLVFPTSGQVRYEGKLLDCRHRPVMIGVVMDQASLDPGLTAFENLFALAGICGRISAKEVRSAIARVGLNPEETLPFSAFSLGMKQRLVLAQAIMEKPEVLLLDEPTNAIDKDGVALVYQILREERARGALLLLSSHVEDTIQTLFDRTLTLSQGRLENE